MTVSAGTRFGPYEILSPLGAGGMGEVYRARDTRLDRTVAVKVQPPHLARDPERRARFEREARAASALNHPHICTLFDIGRQDGVDYLILEYLEGETLADRLQRGALPLAQALRVGAQIADALDKAHRAGIVHRDLKPGNVVLTRSGAKLLDFGLARMADAPAVAADTSTAPTQVKPLTEAGSLLGTFQYMAPEQLEGREADARTDVFALGSILYEMVTGRRAFEGKSQASLIGAILKDEPRSFRELKPLTPPALDRLVKTCLAKDPDDRWQNAHDLAAELQWIPEREEVPSTARGPLRGTILVLSGAVGALAVAGLVWLVLGREAGVRAPTHQVAEAVRFTHEAGLFESPSWSPDGKLVAFASNRSGNFEIYVRRVDGGQEVNVTEHPSEDIQPAFSPDGRLIAFVSTRSSRTGVVRIGQTLGLEYREFGGDLWVSPALGGNARRLAADANYPAWRPDGRGILYVSGPEDKRSLREVPLDGGSARDVLAAAESGWEITRPHYSPDGLWITFGGADSEVFVLPRSGGKPHELLAATDHAWADDGSLFFLRRGAAGGSVIGCVTVDRRTGLVEGPEDVAAVLTGALRDLAVAPGSHELAVAEVEAGFNLTRLPLSSDGSRAAGPEEPLSSGSVRDRYPAYSFDGRRLAYSSNRAGRLEVWVLDLESRREQRVPMPQEGFETYSPGWLPDGNTLVAMASRSDGARSIWLLSLDGSRSEQLLESPRLPTALAAISVSPDGRRLLLQQMEGSEIQLYELDLGTRKERQLTTAPGNKYDGVWSRDGREVAYSANTDGVLQLWTQPADGGPGRQLTFGTERMRHASFSADGRWIYIQPSHRNVWRVPTAGGRLEQVTSFPESGLFLEEPTLSPDGRALVYARWNGGASLWLLRLGPQETPARAGPTR